MSAKIHLLFYFSDIIQKLWTHYSLHLYKLIILRLHFDLKTMLYISNKTSSESLFASESEQVFI